MAPHQSLMDEPPTLFYPGLAVGVGVNEAIFLQQLHWWLNVSDHIIDGRPWTYNGDQDWVDTTLPHLSLRTFQRMTKTLAELGIIITRQLNAHTGDQRKWYTIDYERLTAHLESHEGYQTYRNQRAARREAKRRWQGLKLRS